LNVIGADDTVNIEMHDIPAPATVGGALTADQAFQGHHIPPQQQQLYSDSQWEGFVEEGTHYCLKAVYLQVQRFTGSWDRGIDIAGLTDPKKLLGVWDNYQCRHYNHSLYPSDALVDPTATSLIMKPCDDDLSLR
jgi:hypothetical protein